MIAQLNYKTQRPRYQAGVFYACMPITYKSENREKETLNITTTTGKLLYSKDKTAEIATRPAAKTEEEATVRAASVSSAPPSDDPDADPVVILMDLREARLVRTMIYLKTRGWLTTES